MAFDPDSAPRRPRTSRQVKFVAAGIACLILAVGYGTQILVGERTLATMVFPVAQNTDLSRRVNALLTTPRVTELLAQPVFQTVAWREYVDFRSAEHQASVDAVAWRAQKVFDADVWLPGAHGYYTRALNARMRGGVTGLELAESDVLGVAYGACSQHEAGLTDTEVLSVYVDQPAVFAPLIPEIVAYSLAHCP